VGDDDKKARAALTAHEVNFVGADVQRQLRSRKYPLPISDSYLKQLAVENAEADGNDKPKPVPAANSLVIAEPEQELEDVEMVPPQPTMEQVIEKRTGDLTSQQDAPDTQVRFAEKKRLHWAGKTCASTTRSVHASSLTKLSRPRASNDSGKLALPSALHRPWR